MKIQKPLLLWLCLCVFVSSIVLASNYSQELQDAYDFAYKNKITTQDSIDKADMNWWLTRIAMAKMLSNYAINILWKTPDISKTANFPDVSISLDNDYNWWVTLAYQLWIMWVWIDEFRPFDLVTRAEFGTVLSRILYWDTYNQVWGKYYSKHLNALKKTWIMTKIDNPSQKEIRGYVMLMLMRSWLKDSNKSENLDNDLLESDEKNRKNINYVENANIDSEDYDYIVTDLWYKDRKLNIWWITCFNQIKIEKKVSKAQNIKYIRIKTIDKSNLELESFWFENLEWEKVTEGERIVKNLFTDWNTESLVLCTKLKENYWSGYYNLWFMISKVDSHTPITDEFWHHKKWAYGNFLKYKIIKEKNKDEILSFTVNGSEARLEILKKNNEKCPTIFRKNGSYEIFNFIIHKEERDPEVYLWKIEIIGRGTRLKQRLNDLEIYANGKKIDSNNYKRKFLDYYDGAWWEMQPINISFDKKLDINEDTEIVIKWKFWWRELNNKLEDFSHYNCLQGWWQAWFTTKFTYEKKNIIKMFDKKSWNLIPSEKTIIDDSWIFRARTLNITDNSNVSFQNEQHYVYTCDTLVDYNTTNTHNNYALWVGYWNTYEDNYGHCKIDNNSLDSSSNNNSSNNSSSNNNSSNDNSSNNSSSNDSSSNNSSSNDEDTSSEDSNSSTNCVDIEVDDWNSYSFCIIKRKSNSSKYSVSVTNSEDLSICTVWKGGQTWDFYDCKWDITWMWSTWKINLRLTIKYNSKEYTKKVNYDLTSWVFVEN